VTEEYQHVLSIQQKIRGDSLTVDHLESEMTEEYQQNNRNQIKQISNNEGELLLFQNMTGCSYHYNKVGHQANECPVNNRKENGNNRFNSHFQGFQGKCGSCGL
jgi:hypothetical protein